MRDFDVFISAGEASADILGAAALRRVMTETPPDISIRCCGLAGPFMREAGVEPLNGLALPAAAGILELLPRAAEMLDFRRRLHKAALSKKWDLAILIDMPDLHLSLGRRLEAAGVPVLLYVPPQTWAWRSSRVQQLKHCCRRIAVLFEFEKRHLASHGIESCYVAHPLFEHWRVDAPEPDAQRSRFRVALLPGSRRHEIVRNLPPMLKAAALLAAHENPRFDFEFVCGADNRKALHNMLESNVGVGVALRSEVSWENYDMALCGAGTVSLELAAAATPFILCHRVNPISYALLRSRIKTGLVAMPNILAGYGAAPELLQEQCRAERIADEILLMCGGGLARQRNAWRRLGLALKAQSADIGIERLILDMLDRKDGPESSSARHRSDF